MLTKSFANSGFFSTSDGRIWMGRLLFTINKLCNANVLVATCNHCPYMYVCKSIPATSIPPGKSRANPRHLKKLVKYPVQQAMFIVKCLMPPPPSPHSYCDDQMPGLLSIRPIIYTKILININKHNYFSSIELHKTTGKRQSKWFYCFCRSFMVNK